MPHQSPIIDIRSAKELLKKYNAYLVRWETDFDCQLSEWWHVINDTKYSFDDLSRNTRSKVRRGLKRFKVEKVSKDYIINNGYAVYKESFNSYNTFEIVFSEKEFEHSINQLPNETEFWATIDISNGETVGFSENMVNDQACFLVSIWVTPEALKKYAFYNLIQTMLDYYLNIMNLKYVSDGARTINHITGIHDFLISKFKFRKAYCRLHVVYSPAVSLVVKLCFPFKTLLKRFNSYNNISKLLVLLEQERIRRTFI